MRSFVALRPLCYPSQTRVPVRSRVFARIPRRQLPRLNAEDSKGNGSIKKQVQVDFQELTDLIKMIDDSDIVDFEIQNEGMNLAIKKSEALEETVQFVQNPSLLPSAAVMPPPPPVQSPFQPPPGAPVAEAPKSAPQPPKEAVSGPPDGLQIVSPMSGCFYSAPAPGEPPFAKEGDRVTQGQTVCIIEAMKLMNEIEAEISGEVIKVLVQNGDAITAGQALMIVKPT